MFTGIIEEIGIVAAFDKLSHGADLKISCKKVLDDIKIGDSISVNGVCTTVIKFDNTSFGVNISDQTDYPVISYQDILKRLSNTYKKSN